MLAMYGLVQDYTHWEVVEPLPSYGRGIDLPGWRYRSLINGDDLHDVVITGEDRSVHASIHSCLLRLDMLQ